VIETDTLGAAQFCSQPHCTMRQHHVRCRRRGWSERAVGAGRAVRQLRAYSRQRVAGARGGHAVCSSRSDPNPPPCSNGRGRAGPRGCTMCTADGAQASGAVTLQAALALL
jgi:hypothetical protein